MSWITVLKSKMAWLLTHILNQSVSTLRYHAVIDTITVSLFITVCLCLYFTVALMVSALVICWKSGSPKWLCSYSSKFSSLIFLKPFKTFTSLVVSDVLASSFNKPRNCLSKCGRSSPPTIEQHQTLDHASDMPYRASNVICFQNVIKLLPARILRILLFQWCSHTLIYGLYYRCGIWQQWDHHLKSVVSLGWEGTLSNSNTAFCGNLFVFQDRLNLGTNFFWNQFPKI